MNPRAIITINYNEALGANSRRSMQAAAARWGCDFEEVTRSVHGTVNHPIHSPASMKTLLFNEIGAGRQEIFWLDADTVVSGHCPNPFEEFGIQRSSTGAGIMDLTQSLVVVENGGPRFGDLAQIRSAERYEWGKVQAHVKSVLPDAPFDPPRPPLPQCRERNLYFNSGVMLARRCHYNLFAAAEVVCRADLGLGWHDQTPLNFFASFYGKDCANPVALHFADETWNYIHPEHCLGPDWRMMKKYIYHFAGTCGRRELIESVKWGC